MIVLGLTGSIGMGKSTTAELFRLEGIPVHDADAVVHRLYAGEAVAAIEAAFPGTSGKDGVNRAALGRSVIGKPSAMKKLEAIIHPLVENERREFLKKTTGSGARLAVLDIPLLYETGDEKHCDAVVVVTAPAEIQRRRVLERPGMNEEKFAKLLQSQMPDEEKRKRADFIIDTSIGIDAARQRVSVIIRDLTENTNRWKNRSHA